MSTALHNSPIFGPIQSRRLGVSLGINLMPADGKLCSFDCIYCECGRNSERRPKSRRPTREEVRTALEEKLQEMHEKGPKPDVITFAGNGEPTLHPDFAGVVSDTIALRDKWFPQAKVSVLSNATNLKNENVFNALFKIDNNIQKLDTVHENFIHKVCRPSSNYNIQETVEYLKRFHGHVIIQTMFLGGTFEGEELDNTKEEYLSPWIEALKEIRPSMVMIYTIDRETPVATLKKTSRSWLDNIAGRLEREGFKVQVSY